jgi:hypothetical protein
MFNCTDVQDRVEMTPVGALEPLTTDVGRDLDVGAGRLDGMKAGCRGEAAENIEVVLLDSVEQLQAAAAVLTRI